jgi:hypothetical protein
MSYANINDLFGNGETETEDVTLPGGAVVKVRGLTRYELLMNAKNTEDGATIERRNVSCCLVEPPMSVDQVEQWQRSTTPVAIGRVTDAIRRLSGLGEGAAKSDVPGDGED